MDKKALIVGASRILLPLMEEAARGAGFKPLSVDDEKDAWTEIGRDPSIRCLILDINTLSGQSIEIHERISDCNAESLKVYPLLFSSAKLRGKDGARLDELPAALLGDVMGEFRKRLATAALVVDRADSLHHYIDRSSRYPKALFQMARRKRDSIQSGLDSIAETMATVLGTERAGVWFFDDKQSKIVCVSSYCLSKGGHERIDLELHACDYPAYFSSLKNMRTINADDAVSDPCTREFASGYLIPNGISSMLDTLILYHGKELGVLCAEHSGPPRKWTPDEQDFAVSLADMAGIEIEAEERAKAEREVIRLNESLESKIRERTAELALLNSRYEAILKASSEVGIMSLDASGTIAMTNSGMEKMFGYKPEDLVGRHTPAIFHDPADVARHAEELSRRLGRPVREEDAFLIIPRLEGCERGEWVAFRKDGTPISIQLSVTPIRDGEGGIKGYLGVAADITKLKMASDEIQALSRQNAMILESVAEGIYGVDAFGNIVFINPAAERMLGFSSDELLGRCNESLTRPLPPEGRPPSASQIEDTLRDGLPRRAKDESLLRKDGAPLPVEYSASPLVENGRVVGVVVVFQDISERMRQEREKLRMELELRNAQKLEAIGQLAAGIAHEINTPVQYIGDNLSFLQDSCIAASKHLELVSSLLKEPGFPQELALKVRNSESSTDLAFLMEEIPKALTQSIEGVARIAEIVLAMKEFSHPGGEKAFTDLNKSLMTTATISRNEWKYVAELKTDLSKNLPLVPCLPGEINQVFLNIIVNAAHAIGEVVGNSGQKGLISIKTLLAGEMAEIRIFDTGAGVPASIRDRIFEPFFTTKAVGKGTGQGLPIARSIVVQKHGGELLFESEPGKGTTFIIRLPLKAPKFETEPEETP